MIQQIKNGCKVLGVAKVSLGLGIFWSVAGIMFTPTLKLYNQIIIVLVYLPALYLLCVAPKKVFAQFRQSKALWLLVALVGWALLSLMWSHGVERYGVAIKRELLFLMLLVSSVLWVRRYPHIVRPTLNLLGVIAGLYSIFAICTGHAFTQGRTYGFGGFLDNPNPAGYTIAFMMVLASACWPKRFSLRLVFFSLQLCSLAFVVSTGSRGAMIALAAACLILVVVGKQSGRRLTALGLLIFVVALIMFEPSLVTRGDSYRIELLSAALKLVQLHPWVGLGMGSEYALSIGNTLLNHCHNFIADTTLQYGVIGAFIWACLWFYLGWLAWCLRKGPLAAIPLLAWLFASVALQFDVFVLFGRSRAMWLEVWVPFILIASLDTGRARLPQQKCKELVGPD